MSAERRSTREATQLLLALSGPLIIHNLLFWLDSTSNRYWMGRFLGAEGLAVHTTAAANLMLLELLFAGIGSGCGVLVARSVGARDGRGLSILAGSIAVSAAAWLVIAGVFLVFAGPIAGHLAKEGVAAESVRTYLVYWVVFTIPFNALVGLLTVTAISAGWAKFAVMQAGMHLAMTVVLCPVFLKFTDLGYAAPPLAVGCAGLVNSILLWRMLKTEAAERLHNDKADRRAASDFKLWWQILDIGLPTQLSRVATRIVNVAVVLYVARAGVATLAAFGIAMTFIEICGAACGGFARSVQITMGQDLGAGATARARHVLNVAIPLALLVPTVAVGTLFVLARPIVEAFASDPSVIEEGVRAIRTVSWVVFPAAVWQVLLSAFAVAKAVKRVLLVTIIAQAFPLLVLSVWNGDELVGALLVIGMMYSLCLLFYMALAVPILYRGALAKTPSVG